MSRELPKKFDSHLFTILELLALAIGGALLPAFKIVWKKYFHLDPPDYLQGALPNLVGAVVLAPVAWYIANSLSKKIRGTKTERHDSGQNLRNRTQMLKRVRSDWIEGVLNRSLYSVARINLVMEVDSVAVDLPIRTILRTSEGTPAPLAADTPIGTIFDQQGGAILILGDPGAGKTTLLLELALSLLNRAEQEGSHPIPVVFNLSTWGLRSKPLADWLVSELHERYEVPAALAQRWIDNDQVVPLLDGLDEVTKSKRLSCVDSLNRFRKDHGLLPIAICSRTEDYQNLGRKLRMRSAIVISRLSKTQIINYLNGSERLRPLLFTIKQDPVLGELLRTPLMLSLAVLANTASEPELKRISPVNYQREEIFARFVDAMFERRPISGNYTETEARKWLTLFATALSRREQTQFNLEDLSEAWLPSKWLRNLCRTLFVILCGTVCGFWGAILGIILGRGFINSVSMVESLGFGALDGFVLGGSIALIIGLIGTALELRPTSAIQFDLAGIQSRLSKALRVWLTMTLIGMIFTVIGALNQLVNHGRLTLHVTKHTSLWIDFNAKVGFEAALWIGFAFATVTLLFGEQVARQRLPNESTYRSAKMALAAGLVATVLTATLMGPLRGFGAAMFAATASAIFAFLVAGGLFTLRHVVVRVIMWLSDVAPLNLESFLDDSAARLLLRRVGPSYMFIHRMLLDYFASLD